MKPDWSQEVRNYFAMRRAEKKLNDLRCKYDFREKLRQKIYLDKFLVTLRPYANRHKKEKTHGWKDDT
tara:strand:- start:149 stop:352 length:204 start_codon:yes stop_codon:yes gene_type:complete